MAVAEELLQDIVDAAMEVHDHLGPGLLEHTYRRCLAHELAQRDLVVASEVPMALHYKGLSLRASYRVDLLVAEKIIIEVKSVAFLSAVHKAQLQTYLRLAELSSGLLVNFNTTNLDNGLVFVRM